MSDLTASDVLAMTRNDGGIFGGNNNNWVILFLFFLLFGCGGCRGNDGSFTRAELTDGFNTQDIKREIGEIQMMMGAGFGSMNTEFLKGINSVERTLCDGFNSVNQNLNQLGFNTQQCCCELKTAIHNEGEQTRALIQNNTIQDLRDKVAERDMEIARKDREYLATGLVTAQTIQTNTLEDFMRKLISGAGCGCN